MAALTWPTSSSMLRSSRRARMGSSTFRRRSSSWRRRMSRRSRRVADLFGGQLVVDLLWIRLVIGFGGNDRLRTGKLQRGARSVEVAHRGLDGLVDDRSARAELGGPVVDGEHGVLAEGVVHDGEGA